jgi:putative transposase
VRFISEHKDRVDAGLRWGVEPICAVLREQDCLIAPSTYYDAAGRAPSARSHRRLGRLARLRLSPLVATASRAARWAVTSCWLRHPRPGDHSPGILRLRERRGGLELIGCIVREST